MKRIKDQVWERIINRNVVLISDVKERVQNQIDNQIYDERIIIRVYNKISNQIFDGVKFQVKSKIHERLVEVDI
jgi:hypothetical protein